MISRRETVRMLGLAGAATWLAGRSARFAPLAYGKSSAVKTPRLASGTPTSPERIALIEVFKQRSGGLENQFEAHTHEGKSAMPYRLARPSASGKLPLVIYLHGSGGQGDDNLKQLGLGNIFGTRICLLPENQQAHPCYVLAPQTDRGWVRYDPAKLQENIFEMVPGTGQGVETVLEIVDRLAHEFAIDKHRIYAMGQSMGGAGVWNLIASRPGFFAATAICCGSISQDDGTASPATPVWNFHGDADSVVPVAISRDRIAARRKAGGHPIATEYTGVDHNVWEYAFTEPALLKWMFSQRRG